MINLPESDAGRSLPPESRSQRENLKPALVLLLFSNTPFFGQGFLTQQQSELKAQYVKHDDIGE